MGIYIKNGIWWYSFQLRGQQRIQHSLEVKYDKKKSTRELAQSLFEKEKNNFLNGKNFHLPSAISLKKMLEEIRSVYYRKESRTERSSFKIIVEFFKEKRAAEITIKDILDFYDWRIESGNRGKGCSPITVLRDLDPFQRCYNIAKQKYKQWNITENPVEGANEILLENINLKEYKRKRIASLEELENLYWAFSPLMQEILVFTCYTGARRGEVLNVKWTDIDLLIGAITFQANYTKDGEDRIVPMKDRVYALLSNKSRHSEFVFSDENGAQLSPDGLIRTEFNRVRKNLGIVDLRFHDLRHTFGTYFAESTKDLQALKDIFGHSDIKITSDIYVNLKIPYLKKRINEMPDFMSFVDGKGSKSCYLPATIKNNIYANSLN